MTTRCFLLCILFFVCKGQYDATYKGELTYYGLQSPPGAGHCSSQFSGSSTQPWTTGIKAFMALNRPQYADSSWCGLCIAYRALGPGSGATRPPTSFTYAQISDECPEVKCAAAADDEVIVWWIQYKRQDACPTAVGRSTRSYTCS